MELAQYTKSVSSVGKNEASREFNALVSEESNQTVRQNFGKTYIEVLKHSEGSIDYTSRMTDGYLPLLNNHKDTDLPLGKAYDFMIDTVDSALRAKFLFAENEPVADRAVSLINQDMFTSVSFGYNYSEKDVQFKIIDGYLYGLVNKWVLVECSVVNCPENPNAKIEKSKNELDKELARVIEEVKEVIVEEAKSIDKEVVEIQEIKTTEQPMEEPKEEVKEEVKEEIVVKDELINITDASEPLADSDIQQKSNPITFIKENNTMDKELEVTKPSKVDFDNKVNFKKYSIGRLVKGYLTDKEVNGLEGEVAQEMKSHGFSTLAIPTAAFTKSINFTDATSGKEANVPGFGGYIDALIPQSVVGRLGLTALALAGETTMPRLDALSGPVVHGEKDGAVAAGTATTSKVTFVPKELLAVHEMSFTALKFAPAGFDALIEKALVNQTLAKMDDLAFTNFLAEITNTQVTAITDFKSAAAAAATLELQDKIGDYIATSSAKYVARVKVFNQLKQVALATGGELPLPILYNGLLHGLTCVEAPNMPVVSTDKDPLVLGDWSYAAYSDFSQAPIELRLDLDTKRTETMAIITGLSYFDAHVLAGKPFAKIVTAN